MKLKPEPSISRGAANKIKKNKSLEKRLEVFEEIFSTILNEDKSLIASLLIEKAKYGEHFTQVLAAIGQLDFPGSKEVVLDVAAKCTEDPAQSGCAMVVLNGLGHKAEMTEYWKKQIALNRHPNLQARMLAWGRLFDETRKEADRLMDELLTAHPDVPAQCLKRPAISGIWYMAHWKI